MAGVDTGGMAAARSASRAGAMALRLGSDAINLALLAACVYLADLAWAKARYFYGQSGGVPNPYEYGCSASAKAACSALLQGMLPTLHLRIYWLGLAWLAFVAAVGFAALAVGGARWAYWRAHDALA